MSTSIVSILKQYNDKEYEQLKKQYQLLRKQHHPVFGDISILKRQDEHLIFQVTKTMQNEKQLKQYIKQLTQRHQELKHENIVQVDGYHQVIHNTMCGSNISATIFLDYYDTTLETEVRDRVADQNPYTQSELYYLLSRVSQVFAKMEECGVYHGNINSSQLFLDQQGFVHVYDNALLAIQVNPLVLAQSNKDTILLSPEQLERLKTKDLKCKYNMFQSDVFALGMTMLHVASLKHSSAHYNWQDYSVKFDKVEDTLTSLLNTYSPDFLAMLRQMLSQEPSQRPSFNDIYRWVEQQDKNQNYQPQYQQQQQQQYQVEQQQYQQQQQVEQVEQVNDYNQQQQIQYGSPVQQNYEPMIVTQPQIIQQQPQVIQQQQQQQQVIEHSGQQQVVQQSLQNAQQPVIIEQQQQQQPVVINSNQPVIVHEAKQDFVPRPYNQQQNYIQSQFQPQPIQQQQPPIIQQQPNVIQQQPNIVQQQPNIIQQQPNIIQQQPNIIQQQPNIIQQQPPIIQQQPPIIQQQYNQSYQQPQTTYIPQQNYTTSYVQPSNNVQNNYNQVQSFSNSQNFQQSTGPTVVRNQTSIQSSISSSRMPSGAISQEQMEAMIQSGQIKRGPNGQLVQN